MSDIEASIRKRNTGRANTGRRSTKVDLTPMVDLGFLLITFFVFTTSMSEPKAMNFITPAEGSQPAKESGAMTILLSKDHSLFYYFGQYKNAAANNQITKIDFHTIRRLILEKKNTTDTAYLMYIIKPDSSATFADVINIMDEMAICGIKAGHYAEDEITEEEKDFILHVK